MVCVLREGAILLIIEETVAVVCTDTRGVPSTRLHAASALAAKDELSKMPSNARIRREDCLRIGDDPCTWTELPSASLFNYDMWARCH